MRMPARRRLNRWDVCVCLLALAALGSACAASSAPRGAGGVPPATVSPAAVVTEPIPAPPRRLVRWHRPVEELFVHPLVIDPAAAFADDTLGHGFRDYFVTAREFRVLLDQLWRNGWTLVDVHDVVDGTLRVPQGRKPLVLVEDDVNYYRYFEGRGLASRLVLDADGRVRAELPDRRLTDDDVVPLVEAEVAAHPEFSADGAKGVLAVTGYEGLLGERHPDRPAARARLGALATRLRETGWTFASHTYGHIDLSRSSSAAIMADSDRWRDLATPVLGPVDILVYPYGARPSCSTTSALVGDGFPIQLDIDIVARHDRVCGATIMSRRHVDGLAFDVPERQRPFYDVAIVRDPRRPTG